MRVLHLTRDYPPRRNGGLSVGVPGLVAAAEELDVECLVASFDAWRPRGRARAEALPDGPRTVRLTGEADLPRLRARARAFAPDLVHVHDALLFEEGARAGVPVVFHAHVRQAELRALRGLAEPTLSERAEARALRDAAQILAPSSSTASALDHRRVSVVPFAVPPPYAAEPGDGSILFVGRFVDVKGLGELFGAIRAVVRRAPDARFVIAGGLPDNARAERRWRARFEASASPAAIEATRFAGWCDAPTLDRLYRAASILAAPSWTETFGLAVAEAMGHGLAIVASDVPALREQVLDGREGVLVKPRDAAALADALWRLHSAPNTRAALGVAARAAAQRRTGSIAGALRRAYRAALET